MSLHFGAEGSIAILLYLGAIAAVLASIFWRPVVGIFYLVPLIPLQTMRYRLNDFPLGASVVTIVLVAVAIGVIRRKGTVLPKTPWTVLIGIYAVFTFLSLILGSSYLGLPLPFPGSERFSVWADYMMMPALLLLVAAVEPSRLQMKGIVVMMCLAVLALDRNFLSTVSGRDFSAFSYDLRDAGSMGYAGINGMAAFEAQVAIFLLALAAFEKNLLLKLGYWALGGLSALCLMYSMSRGGYVALLAGWLFLGLAKKRWMLVALIAFVFTWTALVPNAVRERVTMTYDTGGLDHSSETRITLWQDAMQVFDSNIVLGGHAQLLPEAAGRDRHLRTGAVPLAVGQDLPGGTYVLPPRQGSLLCFPGAWPGRVVSDGFCSQYVRGSLELSSGMRLSMGDRRYGRSRP